MRRPMIYVSSMFAAAVIAVHYAGLLTGMALAAVFAALLYSGRSICQNRAMALLLLISYMAGIISYTAYQGRDDPFYGYYGKSTDIVCSVSHVEEEETVSYTHLDVYKRQGLIYWALGSLGVI